MLTISARPANAVEQASPESQTAPEEFISKKKHNTTTSGLWPPLVSWFLPGLDQIIENQYLSAIGYSGTIIATDQLALLHSREEERFQNRDVYQQMDNAERLNHAKFGLNPRKIQLYAQISLATRSMSAYHSFQTAVTNNKNYGYYKFIKHQDSLSEIALAPFEFQFLSRPNTYIPIAAIGFVALLANNLDMPDALTEKRNLDNNDYLFASSQSYLAGTHEEAMFRGWIMPGLRESTDSEMWSNVITSLIFARAHYPNIEIPLPQLILGWHLGNVVADNGYSLREAIFIHTWWDVFAFLTAYQSQEKTGKAKQLPLLWLPPLELNF